MNSTKAGEKICEKLTDGAYDRRYVNST